MAAAGIAAPKDMLEGPHGYYALFEEGHELTGALSALGREWRIAEVAHKPFPSGRATHGVIDGLLEMQKAEDFTAADVSRIEARVPPLTHQLVGRAPHDGMSPNQARLCLAFAAARALRNRGLGVADFQPGALADSDTLDLARRIAVAVDDNPDPGALTPVTVRVSLRDGRELNGGQSIVYGNPRKPMSRDAHLAKFHANWRAGAIDLPPDNAGRLAALIDDIEAVSDMRELVDLMVR
jgi:2-methylcitrate dehydratase PrpD